MPPIQEWRFDPAGDLTGSGVTVGTVFPLTLPKNGLYRIIAVGAAGADGCGSSGNFGKGARVEGNFILKAGASLRILPGKRGWGGGNDAGDGTSGGGGGGSFVAIVDVNSSDILVSESLPVSPLIIGAGGGGSADYCYSSGKGDDGSAENGPSSSGWNGPAVSGASGGSFITGAVGGQYSRGGTAYAGHGGGNAGDDSPTSGGGFTKGGPAYSFIAPTAKDVTRVSGDNTGQGYVIIQLLALLGGKTYHSIEIGGESAEVFHV